HAFFHVREAESLGVDDLSVHGHRERQAGNPPLNPFLALLIGKLPCACERIVGRRLWSCSRRQQRAKHYHQAIKFPRSHPRSHYVSSHECLSHSVFLSEIFPYWSDYQQFAGCLRFTPASFCAKIFSRLSA